MEPMIITLREVVDEIHPVLFVNCETGNSVTISPTKMTIYEKDNESYVEQIAIKNNPHFIKDLLDEGRGAVIIERRIK